MRRSSCAAALIAVLSPIALSAQFECEAPGNSNVARMLAWFATPLAFSQLGSLSRMPAGSVQVGGDLTYVPSPPASITRTDACYTPKSENTSLAKVLPRPRLSVGLGQGFSLEAMYLPPVTIADATPNMGSVALAWVGNPAVWLYGAHLTLRAHATVGEVTGPITCPRSALQRTDRTKVCWSDKPSKDSYRPNVAGVEAAIAGSGGPLRWYGGAGYSSIRPRFQVGFTGLDGSVDNTRVKVDLNRLSAFGGVSLSMTRALELSAQLYSVPDDATTGRAGLSWRVR